MTLSPVAGALFSIRNTKSMQYSKDYPLEPMKEEKALMSLLGIMRKGDMIASKPSQHTLRIVPGQTFLVR